VFAASVCKVLGCFRRHQFELKSRLWAAFSFGELVQLPLLAQPGHGAMSALSPLCDQKRTSLRSYIIDPAPASAFPNLRLAPQRQRGLKLRSKKPEFKVCEAVSDIFHLVSLEAKSIGHHRQTATQLPVALFQVVSNFATFEWCNCRVGDPPPSHRLPFFQLSYFET